MRALAASKPLGVFLEVGCGIGLPTAWILDGMDSKSYLVAIESNPNMLEEAQLQLLDERLEFRLGEPEALLIHLPRKGFDLIVGHAWLNQAALEYLRVGGFYLVLGITPDPVTQEIDTLMQHPSLEAVYLPIGGGMLMFSKKL